MRCAVVCILIVVLNVLFILAGEICENKTGLNIFYMMHQSSRFLDDQNKSVQNFSSLVKRVACQIDSNSAAEWSIMRHWYNLVGGFFPPKKIQHA